MSGAEDVLWRWPSGLIFGDMTQPINRNLSEDFSLLKLYLQKYTCHFMNEKQISKHIIILSLTEVAGEGGTDWAPQKFLLSQQFRYFMRCKKYL